MNTTQMIARLSSGLFVAGVLAAGSGIASAANPNTNHPTVRTVAAISTLATDYNPADEDHQDSNDTGDTGDDHPGVTPTRSPDAETTTHQTVPATQQTGNIPGIFEVTGAGTADDIVTDQPGQTTNHQAQSLPFRLAFTAPADTGLLQIHVTSHGPATCKITFGGRVVATNSGPFGADCVFQTN